MVFPFPCSWLGNAAVCHLFFKKYSCLCFDIWNCCDPGAGRIQWHIQFFLFPPLLLWIAPEPLRQSTDTWCSVFASKSSVSAVTADLILWTFVIQGQSSGACWRFCFICLWFTLSCVCLGIARSGKEYPYNIWRGSSIRQTIIVHGWWFHILMVHVFSWFTWYLVTGGSLEAREHGSLHPSLTVWLGWWMAES